MRKIKLTEEERIILKNIDNKWKYIARDDQGDLFLFTEKPHKTIPLGWGYKTGKSTFFTMFNHLFQFIKRKDKEPYSIEKLLKKITLKEFWESEKVLCIHCDTEEKANMLLEAFDKVGMKWCTNQSYLADNSWIDEKENTVYYNNGAYSSLWDAKKNNCIIYEFEDVYLGE